MSASARAGLESASDTAADARRLWWLTLRYPLHPAVARALAGNPATPPMALRLLCHRGRWDVAAAVATNPRCPRRLQPGLAVHRAWGVRAALAANPAIRPDVLRGIVGAAAWTPHVALYAGANPALDAQMAETLLGHSSPFVRGVAAASSAAPPDALARLGADLAQPAWVLRAVAANPACPPAVADQLLTWLALGGPVHQDPTFNPLTCTGHPADTSVPASTWYSQQARSSGAVKHPLWRVRAAIVASLDRVPIHVASQLCRDPQPEVRRTAARLMGIPPRLARDMTRDADPVVARTASSGRRTNRRRAWARRGKRAVPVLARAGIPIALIGSLSLNAAFRQSPPPAQLRPPAAVATSACAISVPTAKVSGVPAAFLPGGGFITCLMPIDVGYALVTVSAGSVGVTIRAPGSLETSTGVPLTSPQYVAANQTIAFEITPLTATAGVAIDPDGGSAPVIHLTFPASAQ
jgi:hypothetical protein